jgi:hypothetical protein
LDFWFENKPSGNPKIVPKEPQTGFFVKKIIRNFYRGKMWPKNVAPLLKFFKEQPQVNNRPMRENAPNLVTLLFGPLLNLSLVRTYALGYYFKLDWNWGLVSELPPKLAVFTKLPNFSKRNRSANEKVSTWGR